MRLTLAVLLLAGCMGIARVGAQSSADGAAGQHAGFAVFWPRFRAALLAGRADQLSGMAQFPLEVRGTLDSDPVRRIPQSELSTVVAEVLAEDSGLSVTRPETNRAMIDRLPEAYPGQRGVSIGADAARIGPFGFARRQGQWRLVRLYRDDG